MVFVLNSGPSDILPPGPPQAPPLRMRPGSSTRSGNDTERSIAMELLVWAGAAISLLGMAGLFYCIWLAAKAKRAGLPDDEMRQRLKSIVALNMGALFVSAIGLMLVVVGVFLA